MSKTCRLCLDQISGAECLVFAKDRISTAIVEKLRVCLPEIDVDLVKELVVCKSCVDALNKAFNFKCRCLRSENFIRECINKNTTYGGSIETLDVLNHYLIPKITGTRNKNQQKQCDSNNMVLVTNKAEVPESSIARDVSLESNHIPGRQPDSISQPDLNEEKSDSDECTLINEVDPLLCEDIAENKIVLKCEICTFKSTSRRDLHLHVQTHSDECLFVCKTCNCKFLKKPHLTSHSIVHRDEKPYKCDLCDYKCSYKSRLKRHHMVHTGEKPFKCGMCDYKCSRRSHLHSHARVHKGKKLVTTSSMQKTI